MQTLPELLRVVREGIFAHSALATSAVCLGLNRVTFSGVLLIVVETTQNLTVYSVKSC
jgi:hypothetical protein